MRGALLGLQSNISKIRWLRSELLSKRFSASQPCSSQPARTNDRLVHVHVRDGRDADARRLDDVDGVDADARTDVARRRGVVPRHVGRDDGLEFFDYPILSIICYSRMVFSRRIHEDCDSDLRWFHRARCDRSL